MSAGVLWLFQMVQNGLGGRIKQGRYRCRHTQWYLLETKPNFSGLLRNLNNVDYIFSRQGKKMTALLRKPKMQREKMSGFVILCYIRACLDEGQMYHVDIFEKQATKHHVGGIMCCMVVCLSHTNTSLLLLHRELQSQGVFCQKPPIKRNLLKLICVVK